MSGFVRGKVAPERSSSLTTATHQELKTKYGCVAQLVAQLTLNQLVVGSSPTTPKFTIKEGLSPLFCCVNFAYFCTKGTNKGTLYVKNYCETK